MGTFSRLRYVIAANVNALIEKAEDPEKLLRSLIREMEEAGEEARVAGAEMLAEQQHLARLEAQLTGELEQWQSRARKAVEQERDDLARAALTARAEVMERHGIVQRELAHVGERIAQMERDMTVLKSKMSEVKLKLKTGYARSPARSADRAVTGAAVSPSERRVRRALGRFDRLQSQVENLEARVRSYDMGGPAPAVWTSEGTASDPLIEEELQRLKQRMSQASEPGQAGAAT
jgi:phage shock protein A